MNFYGINWLAFATLFISVWLLGNKNKNGYLFAIVSCIFWCATAMMLKETSLFLANFFMAFLNLRGYLKWKSDSIVKKETI